MKKNKAKYTLIALSALILVAALVYGALSFLVREEIKQKTTKTNTLRKYCSTPNVRELQVERHLGGKKLENMHFRRLDKSLKGVSKRLLSLRAKWAFIQPNLGEANPRYLEHIISSLCSIPKAIILSMDKTKDNSKDYSIKIIAKEIFHTKNTKEEIEKQINFSLGKDLPGREMLVKIEEKRSEPVFLIMPNKIKKLLQSTTVLFQNHRLVNMQLGAIEFAKVSVNKKEKFFVERNGNTWNVGVKDKILGKSNSKAEQFVNRLATMQAMEVVKTNINPNNCLGTDSYVRIQLEGIRKRKEVLYFDKPSKGKNKVLACSTGRTSLFHVHKNILSYILVNPKKLRN